MEERAVPKTGLRLPVMTAPIRPVALVGLTLLFCSMFCIIFVRFERLAGEGVAEALFRLAAAPAGVIVPAVMAPSCDVIKLARFVGTGVCAIEWSGA